MPMQTNGEEKDYNSAKTGVPANDIYYYDYNKGEYKNDDFIAVLEYVANEKLKLTLKPYYSVEDTKIFQGTSSGGGKIQKRTRDIKKYGALLDVAMDLGFAKSSIGYHYESSDMNIYTQNYNPVTMAYNGYGVFATTGTTYVNSPYLKFSGSKEYLKWQFGAKYFSFKDSASDGYTTGPAPSYPLVRAPDLDRKAREHKIWLPSVGLSYQLSSELEVYASYGKSFIRPYAYLPLINVYNSNRPAFQGAGVSLQDMFDGYKMEESNNFDLGARYNHGIFEINPTIFYGKHTNLLTNISDSRVKVGGKPVSYQQNIGKATSYGVELEMNAFVNRDLTIFVNPTYTKMTYDEDLSYQGTTFSTKSKQVVDVPELSAKAGVIYRLGAFEMVPTVRYLGTRYGDAAHTEKVDPYALFDFKLSFAQKQFYGIGELKLSLEINNIFDKKYISEINAFDDNRNGAASYYQGAPRNIVFTAGLKF